jgi:hypothetical protein
MRQAQKSKSHFSSFRSESLGESLSAREFFQQRRTGMTMAIAGRDSGVSYATIYRHVVLNGGIRPDTAKKLEEWSEGAISATKTLGFMVAAP